MSKKKLFLKDVMHEIDMLKKLGTPKELAKLNFGRLDFTEQDSCIYGQMTGTCENKRALELMEASCIRVVDSKDDDNGMGLFKNRSFDEGLINFINGTFKKQGWVNFDDDDEVYDRNFRYLSALEAYITLMDAKNEEIIAYLRGEQETLEL